MSNQAKLINLFHRVSGKFIQHYQIDLINSLQACLPCEGLYEIDYDNPVLMIRWTINGYPYVNRYSEIDTDRILKYCKNQWLENIMDQYTQKYTGDVDGSMLSYEPSKREFKKWMTPFVESYHKNKIIREELSKAHLRIKSYKDDWVSQNPEAKKQCIIKYVESQIKDLLNKYDCVSSLDMIQMINLYEVDKIITD